MAIKNFDPNVPSVVGIRNFDLLSEGKVQADSIAGTGAACQLTTSEDFCTAVKTRRSLVLFAVDPDGKLTQASDRAPKQTPTGTFDQWTVEMDLRQSNSHRHSISHPQG